MILLAGMLYLVSPDNLIHANEPVDYVDPKIGTAIKTKRWMLFPGATTPFGMVALSPDNLESIDTIGDLVDSLLEHGQPVDDLD